MYGAPISRTASPTPSAAGAGAFMSPSINDFQIEKVARTPAARKSMVLPPETAPGPGYSRDEIVLRESIGRLLDVKARQFAVTGRVPCDSSQLVLFFRSKSGITHSLDFPINVLEDTPPALDVLIAACRPHQTSDLDAYGDRESLFFPPNLPLTTSLEIANHPIIDAVRSSLFPSLPAGYHLSVLRDKLEVVVSGGRMGRQPISLRNDGRSATIIITLPVRYRGGAVIVTEPSYGENEKFAGRGGKNGDLDWVAFLGDCDYEIDTVQSGCRVSISYGVYIKGYNTPQNIGSPLSGLGLGLPGSAPGLGVDNQSLFTPSDRFFDFLSPILNLSRGKKLGFFLNYSYNADPSQVTAESLIPQLKGGDALLYQAFKMYKLSPELQWTAGGYVWPPNMAIQFPTEDITTGHPNAKSLYNNVRMPGFNVQRGYGVPGREEHLPPVRGAFAGAPYHTAGGHELGDTEADILRIKVEEAGGVPLAEAEIQICTEVDGSPKSVPYGMPRPNPSSTNPVGVEHVYFISSGELEKLVVNTLLVVYIP
ncbi:hypothetical protein NP233_g3611 [Leucocoprinus birnbaumii]|uniref:Uncharacterized protein n=1 Tax=Leucocoprinus birnbaumii TaxID=56174 RepID=A0AAD5VXL9_9AGAR|nr:hypothetical protein NP233_g3611 [Leucocoprinus birnbaumii]